MISHITEVFGREVAIFLPENGQVRTYASSPGYQPDDKELAVADWVYQHDQPAGRGTDTLPAASLRCQPLRTGSGRVGVLGIRPAKSGVLFTPEERQTSQAFADQAALAIERASLAERAQQTDLLKAADKLQTALLNSISHDLRTPLVSITGALSALEQEDGNLNGAARRSLVQTAREEAERLNRLVGNLLDMTRLEAGALKVKREECDAEDLIGTAIGQMEHRLAGRKVQISVPAGIPTIGADFVLIVHVLHNLLDNALKYSSNDTPLEVQARLEGDEVWISVLDRGIGIPEEDLERVFDKFYRVQRPEQVTGTGLGLAICKGILEAHGGRIWAEQRTGRRNQRYHRVAGSRREMSEHLPRILVVDDERPIRRFLNASLSGQYEIAEAASGEDAIRVAAAERPDLIILDLGLPDIDGVEVTRRLREWTQTPIIVVSVREQESDKVAALDAGADDYLTKPFGTRELMARIRAALRRAAEPET